MLGLHKCTNPKLYQMSFNVFQPNFESVLAVLLM